MSVEALRFIDRLCRPAPIIWQWLVSYLCSLLLCVQLAANQRRQPALKL